MEVEAAQWFFDSDVLADEREIVLQPGLWFALGDTDHNGLIWIEKRREELTGARSETEHYHGVGLGVELDLPDDAAVTLGMTYGNERNEAPGESDERADVYGFELSFQRRF